MNKLYGDTVTLYHPDAKSERVVRTVLCGVFYQQGRRELPDANGTKQGAALLLVVPESTAKFGTEYTLLPGDRLWLGEGPEVAWADWPGFVPAAFDAVGIVRYVLPMRLRGRLHHVEAGAWWSGTGTRVHSLTR